jgi:hypothetical protein
MHRYYGDNINKLITRFGNRVLSKLFKPYQVWGDWSLKKLCDFPHILYYLQNKVTIINYDKQEKGAGSISFAEGKGGLTK